MEKAITRELEKVARAKKIGLWRTHPSFFFVALYYLVEGAILAGVFFSQEIVSPAYTSLFEYFPQPLFASVAAIGAILIKCFWFGGE